MQRRTKTVFFSIVPTGVIVVLLGSGILIGRYTVSRPFRGLIEESERVESLGTFFNVKQRKHVSQAYVSSEKAEREMDNYSYSVANVPAPFVGSIPRPGRHHNAVINSLHFRSDQELEMPKPRGTFRIFITGGSTAYGAGAPSQTTTISAYLSELLNSRLATSESSKVELLTLANPAWATTHERIAIENRLSEMQPDMVISFSGNNDVHWGQRGRNIMWFRTYADDQYFDFINMGYLLSGRCRLPDSVVVSELPVPATDVAQRLVKNTRLAAFSLSLDKVPYVFALQPTLAVTEKSLSKREKKILGFAKHAQEGHVDYFRDCYASISDRLSTETIQNVHFVDLSKVFDGMDSEETVFLDSYHFGDRGNRLIAAALFDGIKQIVVKSAQSNSIEARLPNRTRR